MSEPKCKDMLEAIEQCFRAYIGIHMQERRDDAVTALLSLTPKVWFEQGFRHAVVLMEQGLSFKENKA